MKLTLTQSYSGQASGVCQNVFYYENQSGTIDALDLAEQFEVHVLGRLQLVQNSLVQSQNIHVVDLDDPSNFAEFTPETYHLGLVVDAHVLPSWLAWSFQYLRASYASRHGWKRFTGVSEIMLENGLPTSSVLTNLELLEDRLASDIYLLPVSARPMIGRRPGPGEPLDKTQLFPIRGVVRRGLTSQVSRKP